MKYSACLKVQVGNNAPIVRSFMDHEMDNNFGITKEQIAVFSLLKPNFDGSSSWYNLVPFMSLPDSILSVGYMQEVYPAETPNASISLCCYNLALLKESILNEWLLSDDYDSVAPLINNASASELQAILDDNNLSFLKINTQPMTLKIMRCSQQEIDALYMPDMYAPYVDVFDTVRAQLSNNDSALDAKAFNVAEYDSSNDVIVFNTDFSMAIVFDQIPQLVPDLEPPIILT